MSSLKRMPLSMASLSIIMLLLAGCSASKSQSPLKTELINVVDSKGFYTTGLAEITGKVIDPNTPKVEDTKKADYIVGVSVGYGNIVTGEVGTRFVTVSEQNGSFHNWFKISSPRSVLVRGMKDGYIPVYVQAGKNVEIVYDKLNETISYSGDLGRINNELHNAPKFPDGNLQKQNITSSDSLTHSQAIALYEVVEKEWKSQLEDYLINSDLTDVSIKLLKNLPVFKKAFWLLDNEESIGVETPDDYAPLKDALLTDDRYLLAQQWTGGLVDNLARSNLLKRLAKNIDSGKTPNYNEAVMRYMKRFDAMLMFFGISGMPELAQLAVARTLCKGGFLKRTNNLEVALSLADTVIASYIPNPDIAENVRSYARRIMHRDQHYLPDTQEGKMVKDMLAPYSGKYVIMDFWMPDCKPCLKEMKETRELRESSRGNEDWVFLYVTGEDFTSQDAYDRMVSQYLKGDETFLLDHDTYGKLSALFEVGEVPRKILFGRNGEVIDEYYTLDLSDMPK